MQNEITNPKFFEGGKALFTVSNNKGVHYTFKIRKRKDSPYFVSLLTGPDNTSNYTYLGIFNPHHKALILTYASKMKLDSVPVKVFNWAVQKVYEHAPLPEGYGIQHEGRCCRCGRLLTDNVSINRGVGPECWKHFSF
jgi:hypothetical protein